MSRWHWVSRQFTRRLWFRATLIGGVGVLAAILAALAERYIPWDMPRGIGAEAVDSLLGIIASSMLTVTTFSLSIAVSAYSSAATNGTPRATRLLIEDRLTQTVLSTFIGAFLFGIVGLIVLTTGAYGEKGRVVMFVVTIAIIALVVVTLLRWIDHLTRLGHVGETADRVEEVTRTALKARLDDPWLGGVALTNPRQEIPAGAVPIVAEVIGYVRHIDMAALSSICETAGVDIFFNAIPGTFLYAHTPLVWISRSTADVEKPKKAICKAFAIGDERLFDHDPRFGMAVMSEIGSRALSSGTNDPGTAIDVIGRTTRLLSLWARGSERPAIAHKPKYPRLHVPALATEDLFEDGFMLIARDGAGLIEVQLRLQKSLLALARLGDHAFKAAALRQSRIARDRAEVALPVPADRERLDAMVRAEMVDA